MDTTDFTNQIEIENEQEQLDEEIRSTEEDHNLDHASLSHTTTYLNGVKATEQEEKEMKQYASLLSLSAKEAYKHLYNLGLKTEQVRQKLDCLARFFGEFGTSRLSVEQWGHINMWLKDLESLQVKL